MLNDLARYAVTDRQRQVLEAVIKEGSNIKAAKQLNCGRRTVDKIIEGLKKRKSNSNTIEISQPPNGDETIEEILDRKRNLYTRKKSLDDFNKLINVEVIDDRPIAVCLIGDPHIDDDGCDIHTLENDLRIIRETDGMYAGHLGDLTNNWVGRLARLYAHQTTTAVQAVKLMEWMLNQAPNLFLVNGNHDNWQNTDVLSFIMRSHVAVHGSNHARIGLNFPNKRQVRIHARHDFKGHSQYNPTHGHRRAQLWEGNKDHVYVSGHRHCDAASMIPQSDGTCSWAFMVSGYKVIDEYADAGGFTSQRANPSVTIVIDPNASEAELVKPFWDAETAARYLTFLRNK
jgi:DNA-binding CsgD family transcriptional regulator